MFKLFFLAPLIEAVVCYKRIPRKAVPKKRIERIIVNLKSTFSAPLFTLNPPPPPPPKTPERPEPLFCNIIVITKRMDIIICDI